MKDQKFECAGNCNFDYGKHEGVVRPVVVFGHPNGLKGHVFYFDYCEQAVERDVENGWTIVEYDFRANGFNFQIQQAV